MGRHWPTSRSACSVPCSRWTGCRHPAPIPAGSTFPPPRSAFTGPTARWCPPPSAWPLASRPCCPRLVRRGGRGARHPPRPQPGRDLGDVHLGQPRIDRLLPLRQRIRTGSRALDLRGLAGRRAPLSGRIRGGSRRRPARDRRGLRRGLVNRPRHFHSPRRFPAKGCCAANAKPLFLRRCRIRPGARSCRMMASRCPPLPHLPICVP